MTPRSASCGRPPLAATPRRGRRRISKRVRPAGPDTTRSTTGSPMRGRCDRRCRRGLPGRAARRPAVADHAPARSARAPGAGDRLPEATPSRSAATRSGRQRWIAAAAAAGLIVGLGAGELLDLRRTPRSARSCRTQLRRRHAHRARAHRSRAAAPVRAEAPGLTRHRGREAVPTYRQHHRTRPPGRRPRSHRSGRARRRRAPACAGPSAITVSGISVAVPSR